MECDIRSGARELKGDFAADAGAGAGDEGAAGREKVAHKFGIAVKRGMLHLGVLLAEAKMHLPKFWFKRDIADS